MSDLRITELNALTITTSTDEALISDTSASETKKVTIENLFKTPYVGTPQALSGAGSTVVANITAPITNCTSTGAAQVVSLANGVQGQVKICSHTVDAGDVRITPANLDGGSHVVLDAVGDTVVLLFNDGAWQIIGGHGYTVA
jgi:hypothetical protein